MTSLLTSCVAGMVNWPDKTCQLFIGYFDQPIRLEILATVAAVDDDSLTAVGFMRICG